MPAMSALLSIGAETWARPISASEAVKKREPTFGKNRVVLLRRLVVVARPGTSWRWSPGMRLLLAATVLFLAASSIARADDVGCVSTTFNLLSPNDKVCVSDFDDL